MAAAAAAPTSSQLQPLVAISCLPPDRTAPACPALQTPHGNKRKESEALQVQHETQGANKKPRVVWSVEMHQQVGFGGCCAGPAGRGGGACSGWCADSWQCGGAACWAGVDLGRPAAGGWQPSGWR